KESARAETSPRTKSSKAAPLTAPRPTATAPEDAEAEKILENFSLEEDRPSECLRCRGRGYFAGPRVCRDCEGTTYTFKDDGTRSRCKRCKGQSNVIVRLGYCLVFYGSGYLYVP